MSEESKPAEDNAGKNKRKHPEWVSQLTFPVIAAVLGAVLVTAFTPLGTSMREFLFHTRATVGGSVTVDGKPAVNAHLQLDGANRGNTDAGGRFVLTEVGRGQHRLHLELAGAKPRDDMFSVDSGQTALQTGNLEMEPLVRLGYAASVRMPPVARFDYDITLWIIGDPDVLSRIKSVSYTLPTPLSSRPVRRTSASHAFCYRQVGSLSLQDSFLGNSSPALAVVDLGGGQQFQISAPAGTAQPLDCPAQHAGPTAQPSTTPISSQQAPPSQGQSGGPTPSPTPTPTNVPSVIGKSLLDATNTLQAAGFNVNAQQQQAPANAGPVLPGVVWSQSIQSGTQEPPGATITIFYQPQATPTTTPTTTSPTSTPSQ